MLGRPALALLGVSALLFPVLGVRPARAARVATTSADFHQPGTQPSPALSFETAAPTCQTCHGQYVDSRVEPWDAWVTSMMAQAARDPVTRAAAAIASADAGQSVETCIRCHAPIGWLAGRSAAGDFDVLQATDLDGVTCHICHRLVDPIMHPGSPAVDDAILMALGADRPMGTCRLNGTLPCVTDAGCGPSGPCDVDAGQARYAIDPVDRRRGPYDIMGAPHATLLSPFHRSSDLCATCHDVSTPTYTRVGDDSYVLNDLGMPHPTQRPHDMFPEQRTYSEWHASQFAAAGVVFSDGRFGGAKTALLPNTVPVSTCQDCHMPTTNAAGCNSTAARPDLAQHQFGGGNTWVLSAVLSQYGSASGLDSANVAAAHTLTGEFLAKAADITVTQAFDQLTVRVTNQTGHKLPTGYPEGRRTWLNVRFFAGDALVAEDGAYDAATATLDLAHTRKHYETQHVIDAAVASLTGLTAGTPFHLVLNNRVAFDNRIPPRGFTNAAFRAIGAAPVGQNYADGQYWDDTTYPIPPTATRVEVKLYHQTTTREYAEFLRDTTPDVTGPVVYDEWINAGRSAPALLAQGAQALSSRCTPADGPCCGVAEGSGCEDGDTCTAADACQAGVCGGTIGSLDGVGCEVTGISGLSACGDAPAAFRRALTARLNKATAALESVKRLQGRQVAAGRLGRAFAKADAALLRITALDQMAVGAKTPKKRITGECANAVTATVVRARQGLAPLQP